MLRNVPIAPSWKHDVVSALHFCCRYRLLQEDKNSLKNAKREEWSVDCVTLPQFVEAIGADPKNLVRDNGVTSAGCINAYPKILARTLPIASSCTYQRKR